MPEVSGAVKCQEFPLLKVPTETLNRKLRRGQKFIEKESGGINNFCKESQWAGLDDHAVRARLRELKKKLGDLRGKVKNIHKAEKTECELIKARLAHLRYFDLSLSSKKFTTSKFNHP